MGRVLDRLLSADHHVVELATTGRLGVELASGAGSFDVVVLDIGLPDMSGLVVARSIRAGGTTTPILMLTARDSVRDRVDGLDAGADDYLVKPFAYQELSARLRALARRADSPGSDRLPGRRSHQPRRGASQCRGRRSARVAVRPRVRGPGMPHAPPGPGAHPRPAAGPCLADGCGRDAQQRRCVRLVPAAQAGTRGG